MSRLVAFYLLRAPDVRGRGLDDLWELDPDEWEEGHDHVQWLFPLPEPSRFNPDAPLVGADDVAAWRRSPELRANLLVSFRKFLHFLGLELAQDGERWLVRPGPNWHGRRGWWVFPGATRVNHNWLRITRVLKSLRLLDLEPQAQAFLRALQEVYDLEGMISPQSMALWQEALSEPLPC
jgi:hypothetical protein